MDSNPKTFVFIGRSGSGKGTQAKLLSEMLEQEHSGAPIYHLESGARFREFIQGEGYANKLAREVYDSGGLQPEFLAVWVWSDLLINNINGDEHIIIDGTPRKLREAYVLDSAFKFFKRTRPFIVYLNVSRRWSTKRLIDRGRIDDNRSDIESRLNWFDREVTPTINFFRSNPEYHFLEVNGEQTIEKVYEDIIKGLRAYDKGKDRG